MLTPDLETLRAVLDGLDVLLAQKVRPSGRKLQVLDLRQVGQNFWSFWSVWSAAPVRPSRAMSLRETEADCPCTGRQRPLKVVVDLRYSIEDGITREFLMYACDWAQQRKDLVHLCCKRLDLYVWNFDKVRKFLEMVDLNCIEDIEVHIYCHRDRLEQFVPYLIQMKSVRNIIFRNFPGWGPCCPKIGEEIRTAMTSTFLKLDKLQKLQLRRITFDGDHPPLDRCLKTPLESLTITKCWLSEWEMDHLFLCPSMHQLKELDLTGTEVQDIHTKTLQTLLEKVAATLQVLILEDCLIRDFQLSHILPSLSRCHQLMTFNFCGNQISKAALENLLRHTLGLGKLKSVTYPVPLELLSW
nr:PRAME family member 12-like [Microcebus murinus]